MRHWILLSLAMLAFILVPFFLFEAQVSAWAQSLAASRESRWTVASVLSLLLALDVVLPVPSSLVATAEGALAGFSLGTLANWLGMTAGCLLGYVIGARAGRPAANRLLGELEMERIGTASVRMGPWTLVAFRAVPVLAEASVLFAGLTHLPFGRFFFLTSAANLGVSVVYAVIGAYSMTVDSFLLAFGGAILVPLAATMAARVIRL